MNTCRSCNQPIMWAMTEKGNKMPLDAEPVRWGGNIRVHDDGTCSVLHKDEPRMPGEMLYRSHFATCPKAVQNRKKK